MKSTSKTGDRRSGLSHLVLFREKYQVAPFELPLISFPWIKKKKLSRTIVVPVVREEKNCLEMADLRRFGRGKNVVFGFGMKCNSD